MLNKYYILIFLVAFTFQSKAQSIWEADKYKGVPLDKKEIFFFEDFINNKNKWINDSNSKIYSINDSCLIIYNTFSYPISDGKEISINDIKDFEIETEIKFESGEEKDFIGIFWGSITFDEKYNFGFSANSGFTIYKDFSIERTKYQDWKHTDFINKTSYNKLTIRKIDFHYYFFINKRFVYKMSYDILPGNEIGFIIPQKTKVSIKNLTVSYIEIL